MVSQVEHSQSELAVKFKVRLKRSNERSGVVYDAKQERVSVRLNFEGPNVEILRIEANSDKFKVGGRGESGAKRDLLDKIREVRQHIYVTESPDRARLPEMVAKEHIRSNPMTQSRGVGPVQRGFEKGSETAGALYPGPDVQEHTRTFEPVWERVWEPK
ncbi:hypothetical protein DFH06DRAFT_1125905 [Mycena polygramma]|nr:hypothetical protein DFH06DRAFT_1125905 [Mycena polygramma]